MRLGVDPKNDYAFKCLFGSRNRTHVLTHLLNAVLNLPAGMRVETVRILNPITEPVVLDEKLSILDILVRDEQGRYFNVEMQMVPHPALRSRFLYYNSKIYAGQLKTGEHYERLRPVISICFVDCVLFPQSEKWHLWFRLYDKEEGLEYSDHLQIHLFQLPLFVKAAEELDDPLEKWLYLLNNGGEIDTGRIPEKLDEPVYNEAVRVLEMLTKDEMEMARYLAREKARLDALSWEKTVERLQQEVLTSRAEGLAQGRDEGLARGLIRSIHLCEQVLQKTLTSEEELLALSLEALRQRADQLEQEVLKTRGAGS